MILVAVVLGILAALALYALGRSHGRSAERTAYDGANEVMREHIAKVDAQAEKKAEVAIVQHAVQAEKALDLDSGFDEAAAKDLVAGAGVEVKP